MRNLKLAFLGIWVLIFQFGNIPAFGGSLTVFTDQYYYHPGETIHIYISGSGFPSQLQFPSSCQADYIMDYIYDSCPSICAWIITYVTLPHTWNRTHNNSQYNPGIGTHYITAYLHDPWTYYFPSNTWSFEIVPLADINKDGLVDLTDLSSVINAWLSRPGDPNWDPNCDIAEPSDIIDLNDLAAISVYWMHGL